MCRPTINFAAVLVVILLPVYLNSPASATEEISGGGQEYCLSKKPFEARCQRSDVIVMNSAWYGRMRIGRCLESEGDVSSLVKDPSLALGCSVDVLDIMDRRCSGRNHCIVRSTDDELQNERPCHEALKTYMEVDYDCVTVIESDRTCVTPVSTNPVHIMRSSSATKLGCGSRSQPWKLEAPVGQQINVSLLDFGSTIVPGRPSHELYGHIIDKAASLRNISINRRNNERAQLVYVSSSNVLEIVLSQTRDEDEVQSTFLLGFKAVGCSDLIPPDDTWLRRNQNEATVGCYSSRQTWYLRCTGNQWIGVIGNCTREVADQNIPVVHSLSHIDVHEVVIICGIGAMTLIVCSAVICCGLVLLKRHYAKSARKQFQLMGKIEKEFPVGEKNNCGHPLFAQSNMQEASA